MRSLVMMVRPLVESAGLVASARVLAIEPGVVYFLPDMPWPYRASPVCR